MSTESFPTSRTWVEHEPHYEFGRREADVLARFGSGKRVPVVRARDRVYPGLRSVAPSTLPFYQSLARLSHGKYLLDAGCGAGVGSRVLLEHSLNVTALDHDPSALEFAREYTPGADFKQADLCQGPAVDRADAVFVIDVLGHLRQPEAALRGLRACLPPGGQLFVAEPKAYGAQRLLPPACRAFSKAGLVRLLLCAGFDVDSSAFMGSNFVALAARRSTDAALDALVLGFQQAERGEFSAARAEFVRARQSARSDVKLESLLGEAELCLADHDGDGAVRAFFAANELDTKDGRALCGLSRVAFLTGELEDALRFAQGALERDPTEARANSALAIAAEQLAHPDAFNAWRIAANLAPDDVEVATGLARVSAARQNFGFAIQVFERLRRYGEGSAPLLGADFHVTFAWLLLADGRKNDASVEARYAEALAPAHPAVSELREALSAS